MVASASAAGLADSASAMPMSSTVAPSPAFKDRRGVPSAISFPWSMTTSWSSQAVCLFQVLRGEQDRRSFGDELFDHRPDLDPALRVEPGRRLVQEQHRGFATSAAATSRRRRMPPEYVFTGRFAAADTRSNRSSRSFRAGSETTTTADG